MSSGISKFGYSENTSSGIIGPRGPAGLNGTNGTNGNDGKNGTDGKDAVFPLALNYADISGIASLTGPPDSNSTMYINSNIDMNGTNSIYNVKTISGYSAIGQSIIAESRMIFNGGVEIFNDIMNLSLTTNKFLKADSNKIITSADIQINDVSNLSTRLLLNESNTQNITLINTGDPFTPPNQGASLIQSTSANPTFKIKGLTSSNSIFLTPSTNSVNISIDPAFVTRINTLETRTPFKIWYGVQLDPPSTSDVNLTPRTINSFSGSNVFPIGFFQNGQIIKIKFTGSIMSGANGISTWSVYFNNTISFSYTHPTITSGANLSLFTCEITLPIAVAGNNVNIFNTSAVYMQGKNGESPQQPQCMTALAVGSGTNNLITNDLNVRFRQSVPGTNILTVYNVIYEVY